MNSKFRLIPSFLMALTFCCNLFADQKINLPNDLTHPSVGIIVPMKSESIYLQKSITHPKNISIAGIKYTLGKINNKNVVFVNSGLGMINAAIITTRLIRDFHPQLILLSGSSGDINPTLKKGNVVIGRRVVNVDLGKLTAHGNEFPVQFLSDPQTNTLLPLKFDLNKKLIELVRSKNNPPQTVLFGKIATSDALPNLAEQVNLLHEGHFDAIEMEGAAVMQTCWLFKTSCIVIRGISNNAEEPITQADVQLAGDNAAKVLINLIS